MVSENVSEEHGHIAMAYSFFSFLFFFKLLPITTPSLLQKKLKIKKNYYCLFITILTCQNLELHGSVEIGKERKVDVLFFVLFFGFIQSLKPKLMLLRRFGCVYDT